MKRSTTPRTLPVTPVEKTRAVTSGPEAASRNVMTEARAAMNEERWAEAASLLERLVRECRRRGTGHAEALWALAVCRDTLGDEAGALDLLDAAIAADPTALTPHETRDALLARLRGKAEDKSAPRAQRERAAALLAARSSDGGKRKVRHRGKVRRR